MNGMNDAYMLQERVVRAQHGELSEEEETLLVRQVEGIFSFIPVVGRHIVSIARKKDWDKAFYAIGGYIDMCQQGEQNGNVFHIDNSSTNTATSTANSSSAAVTEQSVTQQIERVKIAIEYADNLKPEEKAEATLALTEAERAARSGDTQALAERLGKALEIASKGAGVAKAVLELAPMVIGLLPPA